VLRQLKFTSLEKVPGTSSCARGLSAALNRVLRVMLHTRWSAEAWA
jgi:hypothetical protein